MLRAAALALAFFWCAPVGALEPTSHTIDYKVSRSYLVEVSSKAPRLGLLVLHGAIYEDQLIAGATGYLSPIFKGLSEKYPLAVVYPSGLPGRCAWDRRLACWQMSQPWEDEAFLRDVMDAVGREAGVTRWAAFGFSNGGYYLASLIRSGGGLPIGHVVTCVGGKGWYRDLKLTWTPSLTILSGKRDTSEASPEGKALFEELKKEGYGRRAGLRYVEFDGGHEVPAALVRSTLDGIFAEMQSADREPAPARR